LSILEKQQVRKPDFAVYDGIIHIGSAKVGLRQEVESLTTAQEYSQQIPLTKELVGKSLGEVFAVTYPSRGEKSFIRRRWLGKVLSQTQNHRFLSTRSISVLGF